MQDLYNKQEIERITQALEEMKAEAGDEYSLEKVNLAELERRSGVSRQRLRRLKKNRFEFLPHGNTGKVSPRRGLEGFTGILDTLLRSGVTNSAVCLERLQAVGYTGGATAIKVYIAAHKDLIPAKRHQVDPQGSRGQRYETKPGEAFQMDWGFVKVLDEAGNKYRVACFALCCHHCGSMFIEFFPNAKSHWFSSTLNSGCVLQWIEPALIRVTWKSRYSTLIPRSSSSFPMVSRNAISVM